jgi:hypothetical protein
MRGIEATWRVRGDADAAPVRDGAVGLDRPGVAGPLAHGLGAAGTPARGARERADR